MKTATVVLFSASVALYLVGRWAVVTARNLERARKCLEEFFPIAERMLADERTSPGTAQILQLVGRSLSRRSLPWRLLLSHYRKEQRPLSEELERSLKDIPKLPEDLRTDFVGAMLIAMHCITLQSALAGPRLTRAFFPPGPKADKERQAAELARDVATFGGLSVRAA